MEKGYLLLSDGQLYQGILFGATDICCGELTDVVLKVHDGHPNIADMIRAHKADLVINRLRPSNTLREKSISSGNCRIEDS
jgi:hypothetical protein